MWHYVGQRCWVEGRSPRQQKPPSNQSSKAAEQKSTRSALKLLAVQPLAAVVCSCVCATMRPLRCTRVCRRWWQRSV